MKVSDTTKWTRVLLLFFMLVSTRLVKLLRPFLSPSPSIVLIIYKSPRVYLCFLVFFYFTREIATAKRSFNKTDFFNLKIKRQSTEYIYLHTKEVEWKVVYRNTAPFVNFIDRACTLLRDFRLVAILVGYIVSLLFISLVQIRIWYRLVVVGCC